MDLSLKGKQAIISGDSRGVARAIAGAMQSRGGRGLLIHNASAADGAYMRRIRF